MRIVTRCSCSIDTACWVPGLSHSGPEQKSLIHSPRPLPYPVGNRFWLAVWVGVIGSVASLFTQAFPFFETGALLAQSVPTNNSVPVQGA